MVVKSRVDQISYMQFIPVFAMIFLVPAMYIYLSKEELDVPVLMSTLRIFYQRMFPVIAIMWPVSFSQEYTEGQGNELFFLCNRIKCDKYIKAGVVLSLCMLLDFILGYMMFDIRMSFFIREYIRNVIVVFFLVSMYYCLLYTSGKYILSNMCVGVYVMLCSFFLKNDPVISYVSGKDFSGSACVKYALIIAVSIGLLLLGARNNRYYEKFN